MAGLLSDVIKQMNNVSANPPYDPTVVKVNVGENRSPNLESSHGSGGNHFSDDKVTIRDIWNGNNTESVKDLETPAAPSTGKVPTSSEASTMRSTNHELSSGIPNDDTVVKAQLNLNQNYSSELATNGFDEIIQASDMPKPDKYNSYIRIQGSANDLIHNASEYIKSEMDGNPSIQAWNNSLNAARDVMAVARGANDVAKGVYNVLDTIGMYAEGSGQLGDGLVKVLGDSGALGIMNQITTELNQWDSTNPAYLAKNLIQRFMLQKPRYLTARRLTGNGPATSDTVEDSVRSLFNLAHTVRDTTETINYNLKGLPNELPAFFNTKRSDWPRNGELTAFNTYYWDLIITRPSGSPTNLDQPFHSFFPALSVTLDEVNINSNLSVPLPLDYSLSLPDTFELPRNISIEIQDNRYMVVDKWLRRIMDYMYIPNSRNGIYQGSYKIRPYKKCAFKLDFYLLTPQTKVVRKLTYYAIPNIALNYNGTEDSSLSTTTINFTIVGADNNFFNKSKQGTVI